MCTNTNTHIIEEIVSLRETKVGHTPPHPHEHSHFDASGIGNVRANNLGIG